MFAVFGIGLFSLFILHDTHQILSRSYDGDFVTASLDYYLDFINLLSNFLNFNSN
jgi:FtsH-binding integral membrane protein